MVRVALGVLCASASLALCACGVLPGMESKGTSAKVLYSAEPDMRIRVKRNATAVTVNGAPQLFVRPLGGGKPEFLRAPVRFAGGDGKFTATDAAGTVREYSVSTAVEVHTSENTEESMKPALAVAPIEADGVRFPGFLTLRPNRDVGGGVLDVIATMPIESYLPGVLTHELWPNWPRQTFEAQSVAARTYALHERERAGAKGARSTSRTRPMIRSSAA